MQASKKLNILGIDPGNVRAGYGIVEKNKFGLKYVKSGILEIKNTKETGNQLLLLEKDLKNIINRYRPKIAAIEKIFFSKNIKTAILVSQARGVIYKTLYEKKIKVIELTPQSIKVGISGNGKASKSDIAKMVGIILKINTKKIIDDETDALAAAITVSNVKIFE